MSRLTKYMREQELQNRIRVTLSEYGVVFRTNAGKYWQGKRVWCEQFGEYVLKDIRPVAGLPEGFSDTLFIGQDKVAFIEIKTPRGRVRPAQENFINVMRSYGHRAGIARSVEDAVRIVTDDKYKEIERKD